MASLVRRNRKIVDYAEFGDFENDDDDFACVAAHLTKKSRTQLKEPKKERKEKQKTRKELTQSERQMPVGRISLDDKLYQRNLKVTLALSVKEKSANILEVQNSEEQGLSQVLDDDMLRSGCRQRTAASKALSHQKLLAVDSGDKEHATDSEPETIPDEGSEEDSDDSEGDDEEYAMEKKKTKEKETKQKRQIEKEKMTPKSKMNATVTPSQVMELKSEPTQKKMSRSSEPVGRPLHTSSRVTDKKPTWIPPAASGKSNNSMKYASVKSPTQCLRLGLSRLARVKPLHPSAASS